MLKNRNHQTGLLSIQGFVIGIEMEEGTSIDLISARIADALTWMEGVGRVEVEHLGEVGHETIDAEVLSSDDQAPIIES